MKDQYLKNQFLKTKPGDYGIFGDPIEHSLSPLLQNTALSEWAKERGWAQKDWPVYHAFLVKPNELGDAFGLARAHKLKGLNITVPHKEAACEMVTSLDEFAEKVQAVNTVTLNEDGLKGYNTDGFGFEQSLIGDLHFDPHGKNTFIVGAGGTGKVILFQLIDSGVKKIFIWNRNPDRAGALANSLKPGVDVNLVQTTEEIRVALSSSDLVVNATTVGLKEKDGLPHPGLAFSSGQVYFDVVYHRRTDFLEKAVKAGAQATGGLGMLLHQGARAFEIWTSARAPVQKMKKSLLETLKGKGLNPV